MGFLDRFKKKKDASDSAKESAEEAPVSEESDDELSADESDLPDEFDELQADIDSVTLEDEDEDPLLGELGETKNEARKDTKPKVPVKLIAGIAVGFLFLMILTAVGLFFMFRETDYLPMVEKRVTDFFLALGQKKIPSAYGILSPVLRQKQSQTDFQNAYMSSEWLLEKISRVELNHASYKERGGKGSIKGHVFYEAGTRGSFEVQFAAEEVQKKELVFLTGFSVESRELREASLRASHNAVQEFIKTWDAARLNQFKGSLHPRVQEALGNLKSNLLHSRLVEAGFRDIVFPEDRMVEHAHTEITYEGTATTKLGTRMKGSITVFYSEGSWSVTMVSFEPEAEL